MFELFGDGDRISVIVFIFYSFLMGSLAVSYGLYKLFAALLFVGVVLFVLWANKLKPDELKKWVAWLLVIGLVGMVVLVALDGKGDYRRFGDKGKFRDGKLLEMMDTDDATGAEVEDGTEG